MTIQQLLDYALYNAAIELYSMGVISIDLYNLCRIHCEKSLFYGEYNN